jgi:hypothetical protein
MYPVSSFRFLFGVLKNFFCHPREIGAPGKSETSFHQTRGFPLPSQAEDKLRGNDRLSFQNAKLLQRIIYHWM